MSKKGLGPVLAQVVGSVAGGLLSRRKDRDKETPDKAGKLRDAGIITAAASGGSLALAANGVIDCSTYGLQQEFCNAAHGILLLAGFVMYWIGVGKTNKKPEENGS